MCVENIVEIPFSVEFLVFLFASNKLINIIILAAN